MKRLNPTILVPMSLLLAFPATVMGSSHDAHGQMMRGRSAPDKEPVLATLQDLAQEVRMLRQRIAVLEALKPMITNFMPNYSERFHVMHRAGDAGDWAVAAHEIDEMQRLTRVSKYIDPKLGALMQGFMDGNLRKLKEAVEHGNPKSFQAALKDTVASCNGCHQASGSTIAVTLHVDDSLNMRHPHALRKSTVPKDHTH
jgi:cytochrome c556